MNESVLLAADEIAELVRNHVHYQTTKAHGSQTLKLNYNDGDLSVVEINGRRFDRKKIQAALKRPA